MTQNTLSKQTAKFIATIAQNLPELSGQEMQSWIDKPKALQEALANVFVRAKEAVLSGETAAAAKNHDSFRISVNYDLKLEAAIEAGKYDWKNNGIKDKNFPSKRSGSALVDIRLVHFNKDMSSEDVLKELDKMGLRSAELPELLALGAEYPNEQRKYPVVALGSVWQFWGGHRYVAYLNGHDDKRKLDLLFFSHRWFGLCRFAAVSK